MDDELLKLECLKVAIDKGFRGDEAMLKAVDIFDWLKGRGRHSKIGGGAIAHKDAPKITATIDAELAKQLSMNPLAENEHVKVLGRIGAGEIVDEALSAMKPFCSDSGIPLPEPRNVYNKHAPFTDYLKNDPDKGHD